MMTPCYNSQGIATFCRRRAHFLLLVLGVSVVFAVLYSRFIFCSDIYAYTDLGADTVTAYIPKFISDLRWINGANWGTYSLQYGLGSYCSAPLPEYLNPLNFPLLLFGEGGLRWGILFSVYLRCLCIAVFAYFFFKRLLACKWLATTCSLLWTFSGYIVLWGQHYGFLTNLAGFTIAMCGLQLFLDDDPKKHCVIPAMAYLAYCSYYFLYMSSFFFALFSIVYLRLHGAGMVDIAKKAGTFVLLMLLAMAMAGESLVPKLEAFFNSARTGSLSTQSSLGLFFGLDYLGSFVARFFSNDLLGIADSYTGKANYYEVANICVSALTLFCLSWMAVERNRTALFLAAIAVFLLMLPSISQLLAFRSTTQRWTYLISFSEVILIGFALKSAVSQIHSESFSRKVFSTVVISDVLALLLMGVAAAYAYFSVRPSLNIGACCYAVVCYVAYSVLFALVAYRCKKGEEVSERQNAYRNALLLMLCAELVLINFSSVNNRAIVSQDQWDESMYNDGSAEIAQMIRLEDQSLYRINKTYDSVGYNDQVVQGYYGVGSYSSTNSSNLVDLFHSLGYITEDSETGTASNWIRFSALQPVDNALLGVKYIIANSDDAVNLSYYSLNSFDGDRQVYKSLTMSHFGLAYTKCVSEQDIRALAASARRYAFANYCYTTNGESVQLGNTDLDYSSLGIVERRYHLASDDALFEGEEEGAGILSRRDSPSISPLRVAIGYARRNGVASSGAVFYSWDLPDDNDGLRLVEIRVTYRSGTDQFMLLAYNDGSLDEEIEGTTAWGGGGTRSFQIPPGVVPDSFELWLPNSDYEFEIEEIALTYANDAVVAGNLKSLDNNWEGEFSQNGTQFTGRVLLSNDEGAIFCLPIVYDSHWKLFIDGESAKTLSLNGGLLSFELSSGQHSVVLQYQDYAQLYGLVLSILGWLCYGAVVICSAKKRSNREKRTE